MKNIDNLFKINQENWDIHELNANHEKLFLKKLNAQSNASKKNRNYFIPFAIAASLLIIVGISFYYNSFEKTKNLEFASLETRQTDSIFKILIENELTKIKEKKSPQNKVIIQDALKQIKILDNDYNNIVKELRTDGENKSIILALITNLQIRISFLQNVLQNIENNEKIKNNFNENTI
jgi:hypothetical protein